MPKDNSETPQIHEVLEILKSIEGKTLSIDEKKEHAIEIAEYLLKDSRKNLSRHEKNLQKAIAKMIKKPLEKGIFLTGIDQCFRAKKTIRSAEQITYLIRQFNASSFFSYSTRLCLLFFKYLSPKATKFIVPYLTKKLRKKMANIVISFEDEFSEYLRTKNEENIKINVTHLHEDTLSEQDAKKNLQLYLDDLKESSVECISVKISSIYSQINDLAFDDTIEILAKRLRKLYRHAMDHPMKLSENLERPKFVNLDLDEHNDLNLTVALFIKVLSEPEFHNLSAGITLQAYFPESFEIQKKLIKWAKDRVSSSGAPVKIRIIKGTNLALEQLRSSLANLKQPTYTSKTKVNANFMQMMMHAMIPENARAAHLEIATHNLFDIGLALLTMNEYQVKSYVSFEMQEGMANHIMRSVKKITSNVFVYCPVAKKIDLPYSIAYLIRCLDDSTGHDNFLKHISILKSGSEEWETQSSSFSESLYYIPKLKNTPRRIQDRNVDSSDSDFNSPFENEPKTDFSLMQNIEFAKNTILKLGSLKYDLIPIVINGKAVSENEEGVGYNPSDPKEPYYHYTLANQNHINECLDSANSFFSSWKETKLQERTKLFQQVSKLVRGKRQELLRIIIKDTGKILTEADAEINKAIDYVEYYSRLHMQVDNTRGVRIEPKGIVFIESSWEWPLADPINKIVSALITGNCVIFKPSSKAVLVGWHLANIFWEANIPKEALQFLNLDTKTNSSYLISSPKLNKVTLTNSSDIAKSYLNLKCDLDLSSEISGKNSMIITNMCDVDLAIKDLITSAFSGSGQKRSSISLAIIEKDLYEDANFMKKLKNAAQSLTVGPATDLSTYIGPLIEKPNENLEKALTTLEKKENWLLEPAQDPNNYNLWSPGIKLEVETGSFMHLAEFSGPILSLIRAKNLSSAIEIANSIDGTLSVLHSLDTREQLIWRKNIRSSNCYINRSTKDIKVQIQPFGGFQRYTFGPGYKSGGPNYLYDYLNLYQNDLPKEKHPINTAVNELSSFIEKLDLSAEELGIWYVSISNYAYWWKRMKADKDSSKLVGQDNYLKYVPLKGLTFRVTSNQNEFDIMRVLAAALTCECKLEISFDKENTQLKHLNLSELSLSFKVTNEKESDLIARIKSEQISRIRILEEPSKAICETAALTGCYLSYQPIVANGNIELLHYTKEITTSINYHRRYGNLGIRGGELRKQIL